MAPDLTVNDDDDFQEPLSQYQSQSITSLISSSSSLKKPQKIPTTHQHKKPKHEKPTKSVTVSSNNSIESRLITRLNSDDMGMIAMDSEEEEENDDMGMVAMDSEEEEDDDEYELDILLKLCGEDNDVINYQENNDGFRINGVDSLSPICCPLCGFDISDLIDEQKQLHTNQCLDKLEASSSEVAVINNDAANHSPGQVLDNSPVLSPKKALDLNPVLEWLRNLGLTKYEEIFIREEIDWESLQWLTEEELYSIGITAFGPRKKIIHALSELRRDGNTNKAMEKQDHNSTNIAEENGKQVTTKLITDFFPGSVGATARQRIVVNNKEKNESSGTSGASGKSKNSNKNQTRRGKQRDIPPWCCVPGTPFRVDAFKYLTRDCSHWFLSHFHMDHYQGLTKSFSHGKIYCSSITAKLANLKIGIPWERLEILPLNQKINIAGISVTCFDANHCPGSVIILFELPNGKSVLHTGDFRYSEEMGKIFALQTSRVHTLILDTTYCDPQYDFPKQEAVIQFAIEAIQAEAFNPKTLFLIGSYTIGKERLFLEVARVLRKKIYVNAAKLHILECLELPNEDMQWLTTNEYESQIHVVPMWTLASFKRLKHLSNQYSNRFNLIVAFSPTGWSFGKGKKKSPGRRSQQGTIIRYEVPYSEHSSFTELKEFVKLVSPGNIIPSVNNNGPESCKAMLSLLA